MRADLVKKSNQFKVLRCLKQEGPLSQPEVATRTGLTVASVHSLIRDLEQRGLVLEDGQRASTGGRRAMRYRFFDQCRYLVGVYVSLHRVTCCIFDLGFQVVTRRSRGQDLPGETVQRSIDLLAQEIEATLAQSGLDRRLCAGVGVTLPGAVDGGRGVVLQLFNAPKWVDVPLKAALEQALGLPVTVGKDDNGAVLHYKWTRLRNPLANVVGISVADGIGAGILLGGDIYQSRHHLSGEIGHISVNPAGPLCACGNLGCLELYASNRGLLQRARDRLNQGEVSALRDCARPLGLEDLIQTAREGDCLSRSLFGAAVDALAQSLDQIVKLYDPDEILLACRYLEALPDLFAHLGDQVFARTPLLDRDSLRLDLMSIHDLGVKGAATLPYDRLFGRYETCGLI